MKCKSIVVLALIPLLFGCDQTTKTYTASFTAYPVESKKADATSPSQNGVKATGKQRYRFEGIITETVHSNDEMVTSNEYKLPPLTAKLGWRTKTSIKTSSVTNGKTSFQENKVKVKFNDLGDEYEAHLEATIKKNGSKPISCRQTISIKK